MVRSARRRYGRDMSDFPLWLVIAGLGALAMTVLLIVSMVKTVRFQGWGKQSWAPPAVPWFVASMAVGAVTLVFVFANAALY